MGFFRIPVKLYCLTGLFILGMVGIVVYTVFTLEKQKTDAQVINLAGAQRMLTQKLSKDVLELQLGNLEKIGEIQEIAKQYEKVWSGLEKGDATLNLHAAETSEILGEIHQVQESWKEFSAHVNNIAEIWPQVHQRINSLNETNIPLFNEANTLVQGLGKVMDAETVSVSGRLRAITQRVSKATLQYILFREDAAREESIKFMALQNKIIQGLLEGSTSLKLVKVDDAALRSEIKTFESNWKVFQSNIEAIFAEIANMQESVEYVNTQNIPLLKLSNEVVQALADHSKEKVASMITVEIWTLVILSMLGCAGAFFVIRNITKPLDETVQMIEEMEKGHLNERLDTDLDDEIGRLSSSMDRFAEGLQSEVVATLEKLAEGDLTFEIAPKDQDDLIGVSLKKTGEDLNDIMSQINMAGEQIASGSGQVSDSSQSLSQGATEQASSLEQITSSMTEMASQTKQNAENATQANQLAEKARDAAEQGSQKMKEMVNAMTEINESSESISKIIKTIDEIAFQTNLLALNAAVEAARAGRHGKGFAVVAEEVRNLAARSAKAAEETSEMINSSVKKSEHGTTIANQTAEALAEIVAGVTKACDLVGEIAAASNEQAHGIAQVNQGLGQIDQVTQQSTANSEELAAAAEELSGQASQLKHMLSRFKLKDQNGNGQVSHGAVMAAPPAHPAPAEFHGHAPNGNGQGKPQTAGEKPEKVIALDDKEFGKY